MKTTRQELQTMFQNLNSRFFDNRIEAVQVDFKKNIKIDKKRADAYLNVSDRLIFINDDIRVSKNSITTSLIHEMIHADLIYNRGYRGYSHDAGHGMLFQVEIDKLYRMGAYDGIL